MIYKYYLEIRNRFFLLFTTWFSTIIICYTYKEILLFLCLKPNINIFQDASLYFIFTNLTEVFATYLQLTYFISNQILYVLLIYHLLIFLAPGLYTFEYKNLKLIFILAVFFWGFSIIILNKLLLPLSWRFFLSFQETITNQIFSLYFEAKINEYLNFYVTLYYVCNFNCQIFILLYIFFDLLNGDLNFIKKYRKIFFFLCLLSATFITPPDIVSQLSFSLCLIIIYEVIIVSIILKTVLKFFF